MISRFDKNQNKVIKKQAKPIFRVRLQKEMYMLNSGMLADKSIDGQIGFIWTFLGLQKPLIQSVIKHCSTS